MRQFIRAAALAATLSFAPFAAQAPASPALPGPLTAAAAPVSAHVVRAAAPARETRDPTLAPGQAKADFYVWLARSSENRARAEAFRAYLTAQELDHVVPVWQLLRTSSSWRQCAADRFEVAPRAKWDHIAATLRFVRDEVVPEIGPVEALSAYRNESLNACSDGAPQSAHRHFFALDLAPVSEAVGRPQMIREVCAAHARDGRAYNAGLGFYSGLRFHVDSNGFRKWGPDGRGASSPCVTGIA